MTRVLVVCTGNICRSPMAEVLLRARLHAEGIGDRVSVSSVGTRAMIGQPMTRQAARQALDLGARWSDVVDHTARQLDEHALRTADLVLAMTRDHRRTIVQLRPQSVASTFTLREFVRLAASADLRFEADLGTDDRVRSLMTRIVAGRGAVAKPAEASENDVSDPYRRGDAAYRRAAEQISPAVDVVAGLLRAVGPH